MQRLAGPGLPVRDTNQYCHGIKNQSFHAELAMQKMHKRSHPKNDEQCIAADQRRYWHKE
jgi:hypothetical protein